MRIKIWFALFFFAIYCLSSVSYAFRAARLVDIASFLEKSDLVVIGSVVKRSMICTDIFLADEIRPIYFGSLITIKIGQVLYAEPEIVDAIFSTHDRKRLNADVKRTKPKHILVFDQIGGGMSGPMYIRDRECLFFFKISQFLEKSPYSYLYETTMSGSQRKTPIVSLDQPFLFEAAIPTMDSTRNLKNKPDAKWLPYVEALCEALSIPNQARKEERLRELARDKNPILAQIAYTTLLRVSPTEEARRRAQMIGAAGKARESAEQK